MALSFHKHFQDLKLLFLKVWKVWDLDISGEVSKLFQDLFKPIIYRQSTLTCKCGKKCLWVFLHLLPYLSTLSRRLLNRLPIVTILLYQIPIYTTCNYFRFMKNIYYFCWYMGSRVSFLHKTVVIFNIENCSLCDTLIVAALFIKPLSSLLFGILVAAAIYETHTLATLSWYVYFNNCKRTKTRMANTYLTWSTLFLALFLTYFILLVI